MVAWDEVLAPASLLFRCSEVCLMLLTVVVVRVTLAIVRSVLVEIISSVCTLPTVLLLWSRFYGVKCSTSYDS